MQEAIEKMSSYVEIPAKQLQILVQKYVYRDAMDKISGIKLVLDFINVIYNVNLIAKLEIYIIL